MPRRPATRRPAKDAHIKDAEAGVRSANSMFSQFLAKADPEGHKAEQKKRSGRKPQE